ncbi:MAG: Nif11-like leader peptide family natural product precursor [Nostoc sp.]|uniref:Nif11-like leader peptide family natural product precursor n=1 Tax=Nostoc sp. TaxID=1180 RepID=UPI002FF88CA2
MTVETVSQFLKQAFEDDAILEEVAKTIESGGDREGVVQVAAKYGYQFTPDELGSSIDEMNTAGAKLRQQSTELSDSELEAVAGGAFADVMEALFSSNNAGIGLGSPAWQGSSPTLNKMMDAMTWNTQTKAPNW